MGRFYPPVAQSSSLERLCVKKRESCWCGLSAPHTRDWTTPTVHRQELTLNRAEKLRPRPEHHPPVRATLLNLLIGQTLRVGFEQVLRRPKTADWSGPT